MSAVVLVMVVSPPMKPVHAAPPAVCAAQIVRSAPVGLPVGFATQPSRFGGVPRTKTTIAPVSEI